MTHTFSVLGISKAAYDEIAEKLREAGYHHCFDGPYIDMHGVGLEVERPAPAMRQIDRAADKAFQTDAKFAPFRAGDVDWSA